MSDKKEHIDREAYFRKGSIPWNRSSEDVWSEVEKRISDTPETRVVGINSRRLLLSMAATVLVLVGVTSFMRFYTKTHKTLAGEHYQLNLPDGSVASMNVNTMVSYHPLWWWISREISMEGEAFFEVEKGSEFQVISDRGRTVVLGTSFNIYSRAGKYEVTCVTGKVKVIAGESGDQAVLEKDQKVVLMNSVLVAANREEQLRESTAWLKDEFYFTAAPLSEVFDEISQQYGISIRYQALDYNTYTGYFKKEADIEKVLDLVCKPFGIKFEKVGEGAYHISQDE